MTVEYVIRAAIADMVRGSREPHCGPNDVRRAESEAENMGYATGYAGYLPENQPKRGVLTANWNVFPSRLGDILEKMGFDCAWSDEHSICDGCGLMIRTEPDSFSWRARFNVSHGEIICVDCVQDDAGTSEDYEDT